MTQEQVLEALRQVIDPELGINIVDLGLIYSVDIEDGGIRVAMTMTTQACPLRAQLKQVAESAIRRGVPEAKSIEVKLVWNPPWHPTMMSEAAKRQLGWE